MGGRWRNARWGRRKLERMMLAGIPVDDPAATTNSRTSSEPPALRNSRSPTPSTAAPTRPTSPAAPHQPRPLPARSGSPLLPPLRTKPRRGTPALQRRCSGPPTDSPSGWPRCHGSPGRIKPPTNTPPTNSARRQAPPRAHRTKPEATTGTNNFRPTRCDAPAYSRASNLERANRSQPFEQNRGWARCPTCRKRPLGHESQPARARGVLEVG